MDTFTPVIKQAAATAKNATQKDGTAQAAQLPDNRPEAVAQRQLKAAVPSRQAIRDNRPDQRITDNRIATPVLQQKPNRTGLPNQLKSGVESLSGLSMDDVKVHYNSPRPAQLQAHAYAQGTDIHQAPGQEKHLPHEAWHVVQQKQGRVRPTLQMKGNIAVNDSAGLEREADVMGARAVGVKGEKINTAFSGGVHTGNTVQRVGVGGEKIGFSEIKDESNQEEVDNGVALLMQAWTEAREERAKIKAKVSADMAAYNDAVVQQPSDIKQIEELELENNLTKARVPLTKYEQQLRRKSKIERKLDNIKYYDSKRTQNIINGLKGVKQSNRLIGEARNKDLTLVNLKEAKSNNTTTLRRLDEYLKKMNEHSGLTQIYFDKVATQIPDETELLTSTTYFKDRRLKMADSVIYYKVANGTYLPIARIQTDKNAFHPLVGDNLFDERSKRAIYTKKGMENIRSSNNDSKEYVKDSRGTFTRRYAYVEKNYYQMMEFFMTHHMTGRFQQYMLAGGQTDPQYREASTAMIGNVKKGSLPLVSLSNTQVAVAHQMYGSLPEQRGVSLTSTPKVGVTYANTGGNFRTDNGFKLKIDLARVPHDVLFMNHYSKGGVSDIADSDKDYDTRQHHKAKNGKAPNYKYKQSAAHARELFLEHIKPEWIVEIEHHIQGGFKSANMPNSILKEDTELDLFGKAKQKFGGDEYEHGFAKELAGKAHGRNKSEHYRKGVETARMVIDGYEKGKNAGKKTSAMKAFRETMGKELEDKMSPFHIGYMAGRTGNSLPTSVDKFGENLTPKKTYKLDTGRESQHMATINRLRKKLEEINRKK